MFDFKSILAGLVGGGLGGGIIVYFGREWLNHIFKTRRSEQEQEAQRVKSSLDLVRPAQHQLFNRLVPLLESYLGVAEITLRWYELQEKEPRLKPMINDQISKNQQTYLGELVVTTNYVRDNGHLVPQKLNEDIHELLHLHRRLQGVRIPQATRSQMESELKDIKEVHEKVIRDIAKTIGVDH